VIANVLDLDLSLWRKPRIADLSEVEADAAKFLKAWKPHDWTVMLEDG
jgi:Protein similar to CwfJ C-terminus 2